MFIKLGGSGFYRYFKDRSNLFDFVIIVLSTLDLIIWIITLYDANAKLSSLDTLGSVSQVFRIFRLLRVFKLARSWHSFNYFLVTIGNTLVKISSFSLLLYLFIFTYTILGMEIFAHSLRFNMDNEVVDYFDDTRDDTS